jgi:hypothetical protein
LTLVATTTMMVAAAAAVAAAVTAASDPGSPRRRRARRTRPCLRQRARVLQERVRVHPRLRLQRTTTVLLHRLARRSRSSRTDAWPDSWLCTCDSRKSPILMRLPVRCVHVLFTICAVSLVRPSCSLLSRISCVVDIVASALAFPGMRQGDLVVWYLDQQPGLDSREKLAAERTLVNQVGS